MNYANLIQNITRNIRTNGSQAITAQVLQDVLVDMVGELGQSGALLGGVIDTSFVPDLTNDAQVVYIAESPGTYTNFNSLVVGAGEVAFFYFDGNAWAKSSVDVLEVVNDLSSTATDKALSAAMGKQIGDNISQLGQKVDDLDTFKVSANRSFVQARDVEKDLLFADKNGNVLVRFSGGHIKTKNFDSSLIKRTIDVIPELSPKDLNISDENGKTIFRVVGGYPQTKFFSHQLFGKKISVIGDSISTFAYTTSGDYSGCINPYVNYYQSADTDVHNPEDTWFGQLATKSGAIINRVASYGGGDVVTTLKNYYNRVYSNGESGDTPDVVFVFAGINDWGHNRPIGTLDDYKNNDTSTFYGAYCYLLDKLQETFQDAEIYSMTPVYSAYLGTGLPFDTKNTAGYTIRDIANVIKDICGEMGVHCIDTNKDCGLNRHNYSVFMFDPTHPKRDGLGKIANVVFNKLK